MKNKKQKIIVSLIVALILIVCFFAGCVFAKYISNVTGTTVGDIANWSFKVNESTTAISDSISLVNTIDGSTLVNGKMAPGTSGSFSFEVDATGSEVDVGYYVTFFDENATSGNLVFEYKGNRYGTLQELSNAVSGVLNEENNQKETVTIGWTWLYEAENEENIDINDAQDTLIGESILEYTFDIAVTGYQVQM